jgi:methylenetetrahydrofolate dehydrogenase (NADP+)/methenyltetrahydrofolate cyclohydrolase
VPGGVGPMTIAYLLKNTLIACQLQLAAQARGQQPVDDLALN